MEHNTMMPQQKAQVPPLVWFLGIGLALALAAIFLFNVPVGTVANYGLLAFFVGGHFFMHGSHGGHGGSSGHPHGGPVSNAAASDSSDANQHSGHTGGCH